jgi:hypothetical protein
VPDRREEGILTHEALSAAFTAAGTLWRERPRNREAIERAAATAIESVLSRGGSAVVLAALDRIRVEVALVVASAIDDEAWDFEVAEQPFGSGSVSAWPALVVERDGVRVALRGRIDRVDASHPRSDARAIDYKRSVSLPPIVELGRTALQVPLYALVAQRALGARAANGRYVSTVKPSLVAKSFDERLGQLVSPDGDGSCAVTRTVVGLTESLRHGDITPRPSTPKWCAQCPFDGACRRPRFSFGSEGDD